ncbi:MULTISPECIES: DMT family transporter [unclassified Massilia]|uniref:DMT family transporter n=1 Tax=unclassified Massilia TaxID=2609279 RepID=UPI001785E507|nr:MULTISPECIES: DMT family transporter [unclassified Massilia]MBD8530711.1 DMT family transporter [Massilia sp. CFBP 13647]MBD8676437.1 DMT family transporter [Massilia sp. CFBP 13721]
MPSLWMLFASFAFAAMGAGVKLASEFYTTSELLFYRGLFGFVALFAIVRFQGGTFTTPFKKEHLVRSAVGVTSLWLWFFAIGKLPLATAMTLNYMAPIWMAAGLFLAGWWSKTSTVEWPLVLAVGASFFGVTLVLQPAVETNQWLGGLAGIASSVISAVAYMQVRKLGQMGEPEYRVVFYFSLTTAVAGLVGVLAGDGASSGLPFHGHTPGGALLLVGIGAAALMAQMAMTRAYRVGKVLVVANLQYTGIVFSSLWGLALWGDRFGWHVWLGIGVILASGIAATFYNTRKTAKGAALEKTDPIASEL